MASTAKQYAAQDNITADLSRRVEEQQPEVSPTSKSPNLQVDASIAGGGGGSGASIMTPAPHGVLQQGTASSVPEGAGELEARGGRGGVEGGQADTRPEYGGGDVTAGGDHNGEIVDVGTPARGTEEVHTERGADGAGDNGGHVEVGGGFGRCGHGTDSGLETESEDDPNEDPETRTARRKLRRACDYCTMKKVRCDGTPPCRQCKKRKIECRFSICQRSGPRTPPEPASVVAERLNPTVLTPAALAAAVASATAAGAAVGGAGPQPSPQMATALSGGGITSKTDVTYLNFFLKEFNAFVPLTTQEILRDALNPTPAALTERAPNGGEEFRRQNARVAVIQGCIAIGAMLKGNTQVVVYIRNVREALTNCFDFVSAESMGAFMVTAYCHDLMGNAAATRNYMEFAKAVATQLPQVTVDHELVFQFYRVCSEVHNSSLSATPKLLQHSGASAPCYQVLNVLTYALYDLAHLAAEEFTGSISKAQVMAELNSLLPIIARADGMSRDNASSFGALGMLLVKGVLGYILVRLGRSQSGLEVLSPLVKIVTDNPGLLRQVMCWHICHCMLVIFLEHGWFQEYESVRVVYNRLLHPEKNGEQHFTVWGRGHYQDALQYPPVERLHSMGNSFLCMNPICRAINRDLSEGVHNNSAAQVSVGMGPQPVINMVTGGGFLNFDSEEGVNVSNASNQGVSSPSLCYSLPGFVAGAAPGQQTLRTAHQAGSTVSQAVASDSGHKRALADRTPISATRNGVPEMSGPLPYSTRGGGVWNCSGSARDVGGVSGAMAQQTSQPAGARDNTTTASVNTPATSSTSSH